MRGGCFVSGPFQPSIAALQQQQLQVENCLGMSGLIAAILLLNILHCDFLVPGITERIEHQMSLTQRE